MKSIRPNQPLQNRKQTQILRLKMKALKLVVLLNNSFAILYSLFWVQKSKILSPLSIILSPLSIKYYQRKTLQIRISVCSKLIKQTKKPNKQSDQLLVVTPIEIPAIKSAYNLLVLIIHILLMLSLKNKLRQNNLDRNRRFKR